ncbi:MAG: competence type IV pilus ATPase ComGA [Lactococcus sp.]
MIQKEAKKMIERAVKSGIYDIYIQYEREAYQVYFKGIGARSLEKTYPEAEGQALITHFKFMAGMNVGEKRRTQLGSCWYDTSETKRRLRLSSVGDFNGGESLVIRILHEQSQELKFWFESEKALDKVTLSRGLHLFAGPVGSGKTSVMFDLAARTFAGEQILTVEDPVEMVNAQFLQLQVNETIGNDYEELIKLSLRHRPDLLIVGEIRDRKTARAVLQASLTGFTVFSTVHAKSVSGVHSRLLELGLSAWEIDNVLQTVVYQRLIKGKGVLEIAENDFSSWDDGKWNEKIDALVADGHLTVPQAQKEKIKS